jgi:hypothetical protein
MWKGPIDLADVMDEAKKIRLLDLGNKEQNYFKLDLEIKRKAAEQLKMTIVNRST